MFIVNFAVQQYAQVAAIFMVSPVEGTISQGALIGAVILGGRTMSPLTARKYPPDKQCNYCIRNLHKLIGKRTKQLFLSDKQAKIHWVN